MPPPLMGGQARALLPQIRIFVQNARPVATYAIEFDPGVAPQNTGFRGTLEGVLICDCQN